MVWLFLIALGSFWILAELSSGNGSGGMRAGRRMRTQREDDLYVQIQDAMNWEPGQPRHCECGGWVNDDGEHLKSVTLEELMRDYKKPECSLKETAAQQASRSLK